MRWAVVVLASCSYVPHAADDAAVGVDPTVWWNPAYAHRRPITVTAGAAIDAGYTVSFTADTRGIGALDWRIVRHEQDGNWTELPRWVDDVDGGGPGSETTRTWFAQPVALAAAAADGNTYVYFDNPGETVAPPGSIETVFLFGDDFEAGLSRWTPNGRGETATVQTAVTRAGAGALLVMPGTMEAGGVHRDIELPLAQMLFAHYLRTPATNSSFGDFRTFSVPYAGRSPSWGDGTLRTINELDSSNVLQFGGDTLTSWGPMPYGTDTWHLLEFAYDVAGNHARLRVDGGTWSDSLRDRSNNGLPILSLGLEGEGQGGTFFVDNYTVRRFVEPEPVATAGEIENLP